MPTSPPMMPDRSDTLAYQAGFSLIEILVALSLMAMIIFIIPNPFENNSRTHIQETADNLARGLKMAVDESILRGVVTRLKLDLGKTPQSYVVEFGDKNQGLLPNFNSLEAEQGLTLQEEDEVKKKLESFDKNFNPIQDYSEKALEVPEDVLLLGAASNLNPQLITETSMAIYSYPSGERDSAIILLGTDEEIVALTTQGFTADVKMDFFSLPQDTQTDVDSQRQNKVKELHEQWLKGAPLTQ